MICKKYPKVLALVALCLLPCPVLFAAPIQVFTDLGNGRGIARARGTECLVITPAHLIPDSAKRRNSPSKIELVGVGGARGLGVYSATVGLSEDDTALLRVTENGGAICDETESAELKSKKEATLVLRSERGDLAYIPVEVTRKLNEITEIGPRSELFRLSKMMSGASLVENGRVVGMLLRASTDTDRGVAINLNYISGLLGPWVKAPSSNVTMVRDALQILQSAIDMKPTGDIGHIAAVESLVQAGSGLGGADLRGLSFKQANLMNADFSKALMTGGSFKDARLGAANLRGASLGFSLLEGADFSSSIGEQARFYFILGERSKFNAAKLEGSNWFGASIPGASLRKADLRGAAFPFANLEGADLSGSDLTNAIFIGANITGANFDGAIIDNTDFTAAIGTAEQFSSKQLQGLCARQFSGGGSVNVELTEVVPSTKFSSGKDYRKVGSGLTFLSPGGLAGLRKCSSFQPYPAGRDILWNHGDNEYISESLGLYYKTDLLDKGGRRNQFRDRIRKQHAEIKRAQSAGKFVIHISPYHTKFTTAVKKNLSKVKIEGTSPFLDHDATILLALANDRSLSNTLNWRSLVGSQLGVEQRRRSPDFTVNRYENYWPDFFPEKAIIERLRPEDYELFQQWTLARAKALPTTFRWRHNKNLRVKARPSAAESVLVNPTSSMTPYSPKNSSSGRARRARSVRAEISSEGALSVEGPGTQLGETEIRFAKPRSQLTFDIPIAMAQHLNRFSVYPSFVLLVKSVSHLPAGEESKGSTGRLVLQVEVQSVDLEDNSGVVHFTHTF